MKKRWKHAFAVAAAAAFLVGLCGCGGSSDGGSAGSGAVETGGGASEETPVLRVAMECTYAPFNWTQTTEEVEGGEDVPYGTGKAEPIYGSSYYAYGYDVIVSQMIAEKLGWDLEIHQSEWTSLSMGMEAGDFDCIIAGMAYTEERDLTYDFSGCYYQRVACIVVRSDSELANVTTLTELGEHNVNVCAQLGTTMVDMESEIPNATVVANYETVSEYFEAVSNGTADVAITDVPTAQSALLTNDDLTMIVLDPSDTFEYAYQDCCIAVAEGNEELLGQIQSALDSLDFDMDALMELATILQPAA